MNEPKTEAAPSLAWSDKLLLGYGPMDDIHQEFVELVHALLTCPNDQLVDTLRRFERHAKTHFEQELEWMQSTAFPATDCHRDEHDAVLKSVIEVIPLVEGGNFDVARSLAKALADWFPGHADYLDSALAQWMVKKRTGGAPVVLRRTLASALREED